MYNVPSTKSSFVLRRYPRRVLTGLGSRSGLAGGSCGGFIYGLAAGLLSLRYESPATLEPSAIVGVPICALIPGLMVGSGLGWLYAWLFYRFCPSVTKRRLIISGSLGGLLFGIGLFMPLIGILEFYATIPAASIGGLSGGIVTAVLFWRRLQTLVAMQPDSPQIKL
ncbi:MAG: hypothetical protein LCH85_14070 [Chloroflexi bacterium]|nr:hypothetical protein [Chloroflexota bacterium]